MSKHVGCVTIYKLILTVLLLVILQNKEIYLSGGIGTAFRGACGTRGLNPHGFRQFSHYKNVTSSLSTPLTYIEGLVIKIH